MSEHPLLSKVEETLSGFWGGDVQLAFAEAIPGHLHVARLMVQKAPDSAPQTVILKHRRVEGFSDEFARHLLLTEWASINFLSALLGDESPAPRIYAGDQTEGFLVMEDLGSIHPLQEALWGSDSSVAAQALITIGKILGLVHGKTASHLDVFTRCQQQFNPAYTQPVEHYMDLFQEPVKILERLGIEIPPSARDDLHEAAEKLTRPGNFTSFIHGDPVYPNMIGWQGRWRLIDFEGGFIRHALIEGVNFRMLFPTSGLKDVLRIPETVWRPAESAYRAVLSQHLPDAADESLYGSALTAACAFWTLVFCPVWLERAIAGEDPLEITNHIRQCAIVRFELLVNTTREFQSLTSLGDVFERLIVKLRMQWTEEACNLPLYPAFR